MATPTADFGLIGLAVMGENLALNVESRGNHVAVFNRTTSVVDAFIEGRAKGKKFTGCHSLEELVAATDIQLTAEERAHLQAPYIPHPVLGHS